MDKPFNDKYYMEWIEKDKDVWEVLKHLREIGEDLDYGRIDNRRKKKKAAMELEFIANSLTTDIYIKLKKNEDLMKK